MIYAVSPLAIGIFIAFVLGVLGISSHLARKSQSASGFFAAGGEIHWAVNGIAFAGDYLSAASFLGICGMIAFHGYDGFLYSIGYLAGWIVALFVVAEPMKRMGKYTFADALDSKFNSKRIQLMAAISTLVVSMCYLIPQMVGAGALIKPLLGLPREWGVIMVGGIVIFIVATAGMRSTTYVQFIKGALLIVFSTLLVVSVMARGLSLKPQEDYHEFETLEAEVSGFDVLRIKEPGYSIVGDYRDHDFHLVKLLKNGTERWWQVKGAHLEEILSIVTAPDGQKLYNGKAQNEKAFYQVGHMKTIIQNGKSVERTGSINPVEFLSIIEDSQVVRFKNKTFMDKGRKVQIWYQKPTLGKDIMRPGLKFKVDEGSDLKSKLNFISLMMALFFGTAALPHILIRYYTVPSPKDARKSTILAIAAIGFFYILTLFMGLGAMVSGVIDLESSNMAAPLLAKSFGVILFSCISAIAFATVLGTVSGLIVAASGAVAHDLISNFFGVDLSDKGKVAAGKLAAIIVGLIAIILGIIFKGMNVSFLVGWAFAVAASANLPAILMLLFWKGTTKEGIAASITIGMFTALGIILVSPSMYVRYGLDPATAPFALDNPGIISIPLSFITLVVVSLMTKEKVESRR